MTTAAVVVSSLGQIIMEVSGFFSIMAPVDLDNNEGHVSIVLSYSRH